MKSLSCTILLLAVSPYASAFAPLMMQTSSRTSLSRVSLSMVEEAVGSDISIPYDAAARLAYDDWRAQYNKGDFDPSRYLNFKNNYETISVANVVAKKRARDDGTVSISLMTLNDFGDLSEDEYKLAIESSVPSPLPTSTGDVLSKALEAAELQVQASTALAAAADALAEEEEKLMEMLGLESLEELEIALDSLEGIAPDGGELDTENIAREARIRDAYLKWCKEYNNEPDESRFPTFSNNFLMLEQYAKESAKEMTLNQYADFSKEEYEAMQSGGIAPSTTATTLSSTNGALKTAETSKSLSGFEKILATAAKAAQSAKESFESSLKSASTAAKAVEISVDRDELVETATTSMEKVMEIAAKGLDAGLQAIDEKPPETEEEIAEREARMRVLEEERIEAERRESEARAKRAAEVAERGQQEAARRKEIEVDRAAREKSMLAEAAKAKAEAEKATIAAAQAAAASEAARVAQRAKVEALAAQQARDRARAWEEQQQKLNAQRIKVVAPKRNAWTFNMPSAPKPAPAVKKPQLQKAAPAPAFSLFSSPAPAPLKKKVVVAPKKSIPAQPKPFSFFSNPSTTTVKAPAPVPPKKVSTPSPSFSLFASVPPKPVVKKVAPVPTPAAPKSQPFSFFSSAPSASTVAKKVPSTSGSIGIFASKPIPKKDVKVPTRTGTISINAATKDSAAKPAQKTYTIFNTPKAESTTAKKTTPAQKASTFSLFGSSQVVKPKPELKKPDIKVPNRSGTLSIFGERKTSPPSNVPVLSQWRQTVDGSIVGKVSNSSGFRPGTEITTSPVKKGAKAGTVVTTGSGSKYYLN